ncbi:Rho GTPase activation protein [Spinellus fusiger]|nr:Rho GTPase activation protein [Spinellus fusiger]
MAGVVMPNFMNIDLSLRKEMDEEYGEGNIGYQFQQLDICDYYIEEQTPSPDTPDLVVEGEEGYSSDNSSSPIEKDVFNEYWLHPSRMNSVIICQNTVRTWSAHRTFKKIQQEHRSEAFIAHITNVQSCVRGAKVRHLLAERRKVLSSSVEWISLIQANCRRIIIQRRYQKIIDYYQSNIPSIISIQKLIREKQMKTAFQVLSTHKNPSVSTVKKLIHMLTDNDSDFDNDLEIEALRQQIVENLQENRKLHDRINRLDICIDLFWKNLVTIEEAMKSASIFKKKKTLERCISKLSTQSSVSITSSINKSNEFSHQRFDLYQQLLYCLQTNPEYLTKLLHMASSGKLPRSIDRESTESAVMELFSYAICIREEYLLIKLCESCIKEEVKQVDSPHDFMLGNYSFMRIMVHSNRVFKENSFHRNLLKPLITAITKDESIDLETDPVKIYQATISKEETLTGQKSTRPAMKDSAEALANLQVKEIFHQHLKDLTAATLMFVKELTKESETVPYSIRVIARNLKETLESKFSRESNSMKKVIANFVYYRYLNPVIIAPEQHDIFEAPITSIQRKNLAQISKLLQNISTGKLYKDSDPLVHLNDMIQEASQLFSDWFTKLVDVEDAETHFGLNKFSYKYSWMKPIVHMPIKYLFHLHTMVRNNLDIIAPSKNDSLHDIIEELGLPSIPEDISPDEVLHLQLIERPENTFKDHGLCSDQMLINAKKTAIYVLQIQGNCDLRSILDSPVEVEHEYMWAEYRELEFPENVEKNSATGKRRYLRVTPSATVMDLKCLTFGQLKNITKSHIEFLEKSQTFGTQDVYQCLVNTIARDILHKETYRSRCKSQLSTMNGTLSLLQERHKYLMTLRRKNEDYLVECMNNRALERGKKIRFVLPFTSQYFHLRDLRRKGKVPKYGSYKYTAKKLYDRGILLSLSGVSEKHFDNIPIILSMNQADIVTVEATYSTWGYAAVQINLRYEDLLQLQYDGHQNIPFLDNAGQVDVNLLIYLINKK